jgi:uncharacterized membrane protein
MAQLPEFLRTETWHPLVVHFPIVLLMVATVFKLIFVFNKREVWDYAGSYLLYTGVIAAWIAVYTGGLADAVVVRKLCDHIVLENHENLAYILSILFTVASALDIFWRFLPKFKIMIIQLIIVVIMISGTAVLNYAGHLGASLVYQQAAGVYVPSENCEEFINNK